MAGSPRQPGVVVRAKCALAVATAPRRRRALVLTTCRFGQGVAEDGCEMLGVARETGVPAGEVDEPGAEAFGERGSRALGERAF